MSEIEAWPAGGVWESPPNGPAGKSVGVLPALSSERSAARFGAAIDRLRADKRHSLHVRGVNILAGRLEESRLLRGGPGVAVFAAADFAERNRKAGEIAASSAPPGLAPALSARNTHSVTNSVVRPAARRKAGRRKAGR